MDPSGRKPANPYPDEKAFEDSLVMNFHPGMIVHFHSIPIFIYCSVIKNVQFLDIKEGL
jgi:hypothetical protein